MFPKFVWKGSWSPLSPLPSPLSTLQYGLYMEASNKPLCPPPQPISWYCSLKPEGWANFILKEFPAGAILRIILTQYQYRVHMSAKLAGVSSVFAASSRGGFRILGEGRGDTRQVHRKVQNRLKKLTVLLNPSKSQGSSKTARRRRKACRPLYPPLVSSFIFKVSVSSSESWFNRWNDNEVISVQIFSYVYSQKKWN